MSVLLLASSVTEVRTGLIFWTIVTFLIVAFVLRKFAWGPILTLVREREKQIENAIESAKRERAEAERMLNEQKSAVAEARQKAADEMNKNRAEMDRFRDELMAKSRKEAEALKAEATRSIEDARIKAVNEIKGEAVNLAIQIAEKLISEKLDDTKHRKLAEQFIEQLPGSASQPVRAAAQG